jgi:tripartite-type tricarboxylate transporter receptor subunit TctC
MPSFGPRFILALVLAASTAASAQTADTYPSKPIRLIVPLGAGGGTDVMARMAAKELSEALGQPVVVENKPGVAAVVGTDFVAKAPPDGYTLLVAPSSALVVNPATRKSLPYNSERDFVPVSIMGRLALMLTVNAASPFRSVKDLVDHAKAHPKDVSYASSSPLYQLATELFKQKTGTEFLAVPYKSSGESTNALAGNQVTMALADIPVVAGLVKGGKLRALAYTDTQRSAAFPDVPTVAEVGLGGTEAVTLVGLLAPAGTPMPIVRKLQAVMVNMARKPDVRERFAALGVEPVGSTSEEYAQSIRTDLRLWADVVKRANIQPE